LADRINHGTMLRGSRLRHSKLTEGDIPHIRVLSKAGMNNVQIAKCYGVTRKAISLLVNGKSWAWL
jgi:plasmid maintenance system antidote protein VapI